MRLSSVLNKDSCKSIATIHCSLQSIESLKEYKIWREWRLGHMNIMMRTSLQYLCLLGDRKICLCKGYIFMDLYNYLRKLVDYASCYFALHRLCWLSRLSASRMRWFTIFTSNQRPWMERLSGSSIMWICSKSGPKEITKESLSPKETSLISNCFCQNWALDSVHDYQKKKDYLRWVVAIIESKSISSTYSKAWEKLKLLLKSLCWGKMPSSWIRQ